MVGEAEAWGQQEVLPDQAQLRKRQTFDVRLNDLYFWSVLLMFAFEPMFRFVITYQSQSLGVVIRSLGTKLTFRIFCGMSFAYSILAFFFFQMVANTQPRMRDLQRNEALLIGYVFALAGFFIKAHVHMTNSVASIMGGQHFGMDIPGKTAVFAANDCYYHPLGTASVMVYFGLAIIRASASGILITMTLGVSTCLASLLDRYYLQRSTKEKLEQPLSTSMAGSPADGKRKED